MIAYVNEQEIIANSSKIIRLMMRDDAQLVEMYKLDKNIGNIMAGVLERHSYSVAVT